MGKATDNKIIDDVTKLVRKKQGGRGRRRLSDTAVMQIILERLDPEEMMEYRPGYHPSQMLRFIPRTINYGYTEIIDQLEDSGFITCREPRHNDIFQKTKYCYRTERGTMFLNSLNHIRQ